jgi:hypothetical protein
MAAYTLAVMTNAVEGRDAEFNEWYTNQHLGDVLRVPGFTAARRFKLSEGYSSPHAYLALYEMETDNPAAVLEELTKRAGTPQMPISEAMDPNAGLVLYEGITPLISAK